MTDAILNPSAKNLAGSAKAVTTAPAGTMRPARFADIDLVHARLMEAITTSPYYGDTFKAFEKNRLTKAYLFALIEADPRHILVILDGETPIGFMISGPEYGVLWLYWSYIFPEHRNNGAAMVAMRQFFKHWDNDRFDKVATYTKPDNRVARVLMERFGYKHIATLEKQVFGEDYMLFEHELTKAVPGYDRGLGVGMKARIRYALRRLLPF